MKWLFDSATRKIFLIGIIAAALPVLVASFMRVRPLTAFSKDQLFQMVWRQEGYAIEREVQTNGSSGRTYPEMLAHWQVLKNDLMRLGATQKQATRITVAMQDAIIRPNKTFPRAHWPVLAQRGWIINQPVWIIVIGYPIYVKAPLQGSLLKTALTHPGGEWDYGINIFDINGDEITL